MSFMPEGLEKQVDVQGMADLLADPIDQVPEEAIRVVRGLDADRGLGAFPERLRDLLRDEFAQLVADPASIDMELSLVQQAVTHGR